MRLSSSNVTEYLTKLHLLSPLDPKNLKIVPLIAKNFNLLVTLPNEEQYLVKQERQNQEGKSAGEFQGEWRIQQFVREFPELAHFSGFIPDILDYDPKESLMVISYLNHYHDLSDFYQKTKGYYPQIAAQIGTVLGTIHQTTFNNIKYQKFFTKSSEKMSVNQVPVTRLIQRLEQITPDIFGQVPADGIKFFTLYQRYDSLGQAIAELGESFTPCCLTHNDLKLNNILLHQDWNNVYSSFKETENTIRLIDWERSNWGDPCFDLGTLIASYLQIWLSSLVVSKSLSIEESLRLAVTPLEQLQPSIRVLLTTYLKTFTTIEQEYPDFLKRVIQYAGFCFIQQIQAMIQYQKSFGNGGICMLQVAKSLLCRPEASMSTILGSNLTFNSQKIS